MRINIFVNLLPSKIPSEAYYVPQMLHILFRKETRLKGCNRVTKKNRISRLRFIYHLYLVPW